MDDVQGIGAGALIATAIRSATPGTDDEDALWEALEAYVKAATVEEALATARGLCTAPDLPRRFVGARLIAERLNPYLPELAEFVAVVERVAATDTDPQVLGEALRALGYTGLERTLPTILPLASHESADVRLGVARALFSCAGVPPRREAICRDAIDALIELSSDSDDDVRDWSSFALGGLDVDDDSVRDALAARLDDAHLDTQCEAIVGLARRGDKRAFAPTLALLEAESVPRLAVEAAALLGDDRLLDALQALERWWDIDDELLALARERCTPAVRDARHAQELRVAELVELRFADTAPHAELQSVRIDREYLGILNDLTITWLNAAGEPGEASWGFEFVFARADVENDPDRAVTLMLRQLIEAHAPAP